MYNQRSVTCNDNFESKLNNRSTPKKLQSYNDEKKVSNDVIFSEFQIVKDETNKSFLKCNERLDKLDNKLIELNVSTQNNLSLAFDDIFKRLIDMETKISSFTKLNNDNDSLKTQVNQLLSEVNALKKTKVESQNNLEQRVLLQIKENSNKVEKMLNDQMAVFNQMFSENYSQNANLINQILINQMTSSFVITDTHKEVVKCLEKTSNHTDKPEVVDKSLIIKSSPNMKPKGDITENETDNSSLNKSNNVVTVDQNEKPPGVFASLNLPNINKTNTKPGDLFGDMGKPAFVQPTAENDSSILFSKNSSNESFKTSSGLFTSGNTSSAVTKETNLFNNKSSEKSQSTIFGVKPEPVKPSLFGVKSETPQTSLFGVKSESPQTSLFGGKSETNMFGSKSEVAQSNLFGVKSVSTQPGIFGVKSDNSSSLFSGITKTSEKSSNLFGNTTPQAEFSFLSAAENSSNPIFGGNTNQTSFSSLSSATKVGFGSESEVNWKAGSKLFGNVSTKTEAHDESAEQNPEEETEEHDPHFQPIIELPPLVQIQKDEESHDVLFRNRCKLYRFIGSEWKERGVGEMKILQTKEEVNGTKEVKLVMRRDQIRKLCCNQRVLKSMPIFAPMPNEKSTCWVGNDYSEGSSSSEKFAIRFASVDLLAEFKRIISKVQDELPSEDNAE